MFTDRHVSRYSNGCTGGTEGIQQVRSGWMVVQSKTIIMIPKLKMMEVNQADGSTDWPVKTVQSVQP